MIFNTMTIEEVSNILKINGNNNQEPYNLLKSFYEDLKLAFNKEEEKNNLKGIFQEFDDVYGFTCEVIYKLNEDFIKQIESNTLSKDLVNITDNLVQMCIISKVPDSNDYRSIFERHFQYIRNGMLEIKDFTYNGFIKYITYLHLGGNNRAA